MRRLVVACALVALAATSAAQAATQLGIFGNLQRFQSLTGQQSQVGHVIVGWGQTTFDQIWPTLGPVPMLGFATGQDAITPLAIAHGAGDSFLLAMSESARGLGKPVYIRPMGEMNGHWSACCAYNQNGSPRNAAHSTAAFRQAFARIYLIMHGGPKVNAALRRLGAQAYYPGDEYVDMVGDDLYDIRFKAERPAADALYRAHPGKPFSFPEWGLWGIDDPAFVKQMATFVQTHRRTKMIAYFNAKPGSIFDLQSKPHSLAAYKRYIVPLG